MTPPGAAPTRRRSGFTGRTARWCFSKNINLVADNELHDIPVPPEAFDALEHQRLMHFFRPFFRRATSRSAPPPCTSPWTGRARIPRAGFFFAGRLWNGETLKSLVSDADDHLKFLPAIPPPHEATTEDDADDGVISFTRTLKGWDNRPVARILVCNDSKTIGELNQSTHWLLALLVGFALALLLLLTGFADLVGEPAVAPDLADAQDGAALAPG